MNWKKIMMVDFNGPDVFMGPSDIADSRHEGYNTHYHQFIGHMGNYRINVCDQVQCSAG